MAAHKDYNTLHSHERDNLLSFDSVNHIYTHANGLTFKSVTTLVEECFEKFDVDYWAPRIAKKSGITESDLRAQWEAKAENARTLGTLMHSKIEKYYLGETPVTDETLRLFELFTRDNNLNPYRTEWAIYDEESGIAGTLDFLDYTDGQFTIYDWKRSDKIIENGQPLISNRYNKTAYPPISHIPDTTYWHYALQLSIYRYILQKNYDITIRSNRLAIFHPSYQTYHLIDVPYLEKEAHLLLTKK